MIQIEEYARRPAQNCCCFCRGEYIRITYTLWPLFRAAFCIQNNIKGLFILHCLPFVLSEKLGVCARECACVYMNSKLVRRNVTFCLFGCCGVSKNMLCKCLTISDDGQNGQIHLSFPEGAFLQGDAVSRGSKDVPERNKLKRESIHPPAFLVSEHFAISLYPLTGFL